MRMEISEKLVFIVVLPPFRRANNEGMSDFILFAIWRNKKQGDPSSTLSASHSGLAFQVQHACVDLNLK